MRRPIPAESTPGTTGRCTVSNPAPTMFRTPASVRTKSAITMKSSSGMGFTVSATAGASGRVAVDGELHVAGLDEGAGSGGAVEAGRGAGCAGDADRAVV